MIVRKTRVNVTMTIKLKLAAMTLDGGSKTFADNKGQLYWQCFEINNEKDKGKLFIGNINDKPHKLASGTFKLIDRESESIITQ